MGWWVSREQYERVINRVRRQEHEKATTELNNEITNVESQFQQELKKLSDSNSKRERKQQEVINKLQQQEKKCSSLVESLRSNLAETQQHLVTIDKLETQVLEDRKRRAEELESEKAGREEALAKISSLELVIEATTRDLDFERRRLKGAREGITLMETRLRAFCSTIEEIRHLFAKQQEKVEAMHKALEEKENDETRLVQGAQTTSNDTMEPGSVQS